MLIPRLRVLSYTTLVDAKICLTSPMGPNPSFHHIPSCITPINPEGHGKRSMPPWKKKKKRGVWLDVGLFENRALQTPRGFYIILPIHLATFSGAPFWSPLDKHVGVMNHSSVNKAIIPSPNIKHPKKKCSNRRSTRTWDHCILKEC